MEEPDNWNTAREMQKRGVGRSARFTGFRRVQAVGLRLPLLLFSPSAGRATNAARANVLKVKTEEEKWKK